MQPNAGRKKITSLLFVDPLCPGCPMPFVGRDRFQRILIGKFAN